MSETRPANLLDQNYQGTVNQKPKKDMIKIATAASLILGACCFVAVTCVALKINNLGTLAATRKISILVGSIAGGGFLVIAICGGIAKKVLGAGSKTRNVTSIDDSIDPEPKPEENEKNTFNKGSNDFQDQIRKQKKIIEEKKAKAADKKNLSPNTPPKQSFKDQLKKQIKSKEQDKKKNEEIQKQRAQLDAKIQTEVANCKSNQDFFAWILRNKNCLMSNDKVRERAVLVIKNKEVSEDELREFCKHFKPSTLLTLLSLTQTENLFNAIDPDIIESALIIETQFIQKLNKKAPHRNPELRKKIEQRPLGPSIFRHSMNKTEIESVGKKFLEEQEESGCFMNSSTFETRHGNDSFLLRGKEFSIMLVVNYLRQIIQETGFKNVRVARTIAVIDKNANNTVRFRLDPANLSLHCENISIYRETIETITRSPTQEEKQEFAEIIRFSGLNQFANTFVFGKNSKGEEGFYLLDTDYLNFSLVPFLNRSSESVLKNLLGEKMFEYQKDNKLVAHRHKILNQHEEINSHNKTYVPKEERQKFEVKFDYTLKIATSKENT